MKTTIIVQDKEHLKLLIQQEITLHGNNCDLNHIDTSKITDMSFMFFQSEYNGDISQWDISYVTDMHAMFYESEFNGNISNWNVYNVTNMSAMFYESQFNRDINKWNVSNVKDMNYIFHNSNSSKPWWAIEDNEQRNIAINNYQLMRQLEEKLISKEKLNKDKKSKI